MLVPSTELKVSQAQSPTPSFLGDDGQILQTNLAALTPKPRSVLTPCLLEVAKPG